MIAAVNDSGHPKLGINQKLKDELRADSAIAGIVGGAASGHDHLFLVLGEAKPNLLRGGGQKGQNHEAPDDGDHALDEENPLPGGPPVPATEVLLHTVAEQAVERARERRCRVYDGTTGRQLGVSVPEGEVQDRALDEGLYDADEKSYRH